jgi:hypothetical protein
MFRVSKRSVEMDAKIAFRLQFAHGPDTSG